MRVVNVKIRLLILGALALQPLQASKAAQLPPLPGGLVVAMTSPASGSTVSSSITVSANVTPLGVLVAGVQFKLDNADLGAEDATAPYSISWNTVTATNGAHVLTAVARNTLGVRFSSDPVTVTVSNDQTPPSVAITSPAAGSTVGGSIAVTASASDNVAVAGVQFKVDGVALGAEDTAPPYSVPWDTTAATNSPHTLTAVARDTAGNSSTSASVTVTVFNDTTPPQVTITSPSPGSSVAGTVTIAANASDNVVVAGVQFNVDGIVFGAEDTSAPYSIAWDTTTWAKGSHSLTAVGRDAAGNRTTSSSSTVTVYSVTTFENQQPGSGNWQMWLGEFRNAEDVNKQIKGYASATSVNKGGSITFFVTVNPSQTFTMDIYRMGWYQGLGGRLMQRIGPLNGVQQPACPVDPATGLIECQWTASYTLAVPTTWTSGVFLVQLTNAQGYQNYIDFVVRDDARSADILYQQSVTTYQAYNNYPNDGAAGKSLYEYNSFGANTITGTTRAVKVSFNRPYPQDGNGQFLSYEYYFVRWLERSGYDVTYSTDLDTHQNSARLLNSKAFLSVGHDEYWSKPMYDGVEDARNRGIHLGFFGANAVFWQVRFEPSPVSGVSDRVMVCYKERALDPVQGPTTTLTWRDPFINRPEQNLIGVQYVSDLAVTSAPYVVMNSSNWVYAGTGVVDGSSIPGIVGYEADASMTSAPLPQSIPGTYTVLSNSPFVDHSNQTRFGNSSVYQAPSGAWVFGAGTIEWSWGLDYPGIADARIQQTTANLLNRFVASSPAP